MRRPAQRHRLTERTQRRVSSGREQGGYPVFRPRDDPTAASLGALLMHFMLETIIAAHLMGVDAFDQPAVEEGKVLAKQYLAGKG